MKPPIECGLDHNRAQNPAQRCEVGLRGMAEPPKSLTLKMAEEAAKSWRRIRAHEKVAELLGGTRYNDGLAVTDDPPDAQDEQREAAA